jgi:uncharacterized membrane protein YphA (DoxX/SURF4 family)
MGVVGFLKVLFAALLIAGIWFSPATKPAAAGMAVLMLGAVSIAGSRHARVVPDRRSRLRDRTSWRSGTSTLSKHVQ